MLELGDESDVSSPAQSTLTTNSWVNLGTPVPGSVGTTCVTDSVRSIEKRFYRVTQLP